MKVYGTAYKNVVANMPTIKTDANEIEKDFDANDFYGAAKEASTIAKIALPLPPSYEASITCGDFSLTTVEVADYLSGFIYGFTGVDHKDYFEKCFQDTQAFEQDVCDAVTDFRTKDNQKVIAGVKKLLGDLPELSGWLAACPDAKADIATVGTWFKYWKAQGEMKVYGTAYKNVVGNMPTIKTDVAKLETDYDGQNFYGVGADVSGIAVIALPKPTSLGDVTCGDFSLTDT